MYKVLFVDDELSALEGFQRMLHKNFDIDVAPGGDAGLLAIKTSGPYSVVVSDMRMPGMNGAEFLAAVRIHSPDTTRILLTGYADVDSAMAAVNQGHIFRFLKKPCEKDSLVQSINDACAQYDLIVGQRDMLENTLLGSIRMMADALSAADPEAFSRSMRVARYMRHLAHKFAVNQPWQLDAAAVLSHLGYLTLDAELLRAVYSDRTLTPAEQQRFQRHPIVAKKLISQVPRLEPVAWMIGQQLKEGPLELPRNFLFPQDIWLGARMLRLSVSAANIRRHVCSDDEVLDELYGRFRDVDRDLVDGLSDIEPEQARMQSQLLSISELTSGMLLDQEVHTQSGTLLARKGQEVTPALIARLENSYHSGAIDREITVLAANQITIQT